MKDFLTPIEYHKLPYNKRLDIVTKTYIIKCTCEELFKNKRINNVYFAIRKVFIKKEPTDLQILYDYLYTLDKENIGLTTLFDNAYRYLDAQKFIAGEEKKVLIPKYEKSLLDTLMEMK